MLFRSVGTVAAAAAANAVNATDITVFGAIWDKFATQNVTRWRDGVRLKYYGGNTTATTLTDLLASLDGNGQCNSWAEFLIATASIQGVAGTQRIEVTATGSQTFNGVANAFSGFAVKNTQLPTGPVPEVTLARSTSGLVGQGGILPSQYRFGRHYVVGFNNKYFDPSYGGTAGNLTETQWESLAVSYLMFTHNGVPYAALFTNANQITFVERPF